MRCASDLNSWSVRTSASTGAPGSPIRRESCATVISVGEGMVASTSEEDMDAMFQAEASRGNRGRPPATNAHQRNNKVNPLDAYSQAAVRAHARGMHPIQGGTPDFIPMCSRRRFCTKYARARAHVRRSQSRYPL